MFVLDLKNVSFSSGWKIPCIKAYRKLTGAPLKEAKDFVEDAVTEPQSFLIRHPDSKSLGILNKYGTVKSCNHDEWEERYIKGLKEIRSLATLAGDDYVARLIKKVEECMGF